MFYPGARDFGDHFLADHDSASSTWGQIHSTNTCTPEPPCCVDKAPAARLSRAELDSFFPGDWGVDVSYGWLFNYTQNLVYVFNSAGQETDYAIVCVCVCAAVSACGWGKNLEYGYRQGIKNELNKQDRNRSAALRVVEYEGELLVGFNGTVPGSWPILACGGAHSMLPTRVGSVLGSVVVVLWFL
ncbi:hypothetical protein BJY01DRAFT_247809 [Aspergillus pseudoustus]|uniref:DUF7732 domain-containing protein n=1 Tax=Aspergillus pseudoustus TaxID=1810923 RepID=A0ABR4JYR7_9EURO